MKVTDRGAGRDVLRRLSFLYQDGMVLATTLRGLDAIGLLDASPDERTAQDTVAALLPNLDERGFAHLRVGLRTLAQAGWLEAAPGLTPATTTMTWTPAGRAIARHHGDYLALGDLLATLTASDPDACAQPWTTGRAEQFAALVERAAARWELDDLEPDLRDEVRAHLDGALTAPALLWLDATGALQPDAPVPPVDETGEAIGRLLTAIGWVGEDGAWTQDGVHGLEFVPHLGLTGSYLPLFARLPELYSGELSVADADGDDCWHMQRALNTRSNGVAQGRYKADADPLFASIFDREPLDEQPRFVMHTGCGDAEWLERIHTLVRATTLRGRHLDEHPLLMVGADGDGPTLERARARLAAADADGLVVRGDVSDPEALRARLAEHDLAIEDGLHVHAFVHHERPLGAGGEPKGGPLMSSGAYLSGDGEPNGGRPLMSSGAYLSGDGEVVDGSDVEADLAAHLARWTPHVARHGIVVLEAHCVTPLVAARHLGALHSLAFDAYTGYSGHYPVERPAFIRALRSAGLRQGAAGERRYPTTRPFVAVSMNHLYRGTLDGMLPAWDPAQPRQDTWRPDPGVDLRDGYGLHELVFEGGDLRHPRLWSSASTSVLVTQTMDIIEQRVERLGPGDVLRVLDYGTGTALAAIELLKACRERGFEARLKRRGVEFELHLVDIPSSWFALGHKLVKDLAWTRCHSLIGPDGRFRPLKEVTKGVRMDVVMSSMVFHLIPPKAVARVAEGLADITAHDGHLLWNAPDLGPAGPSAVLFHDPNRAVRARWKSLLLGETAPASEVQAAAVAAARLRAADGAPLIDDERANRRILPRAHMGPEIGDALRGSFAGEVTTQTHEIVQSETLDTLLVPSNQGEYLPEIEDDALRSGLVTELMLGEVLPELRAGHASTGFGYNVHWTFGDFRPNGG